MYTGPEEESKMSVLMIKISYAASPGEGLGGGGGGIIMSGAVVVPF